MTASKYQITNCRICSSNRLYKFLSLGAMPTPNGYLEKKDLNKKEPLYPLGICVCLDCWLVQLTHVVPAEIMFKNYLYIPSTSQTLMNNFSAIAEDLTQKYQVPKNSLVIDVGSNDGTLLSFFKNREMRVLGVDPASNLVQVARLKGIETICDFFTSNLAKEIMKKHGKAKLITSTNSFAHLNNLHDICKALSLLLDKDGVAFLEFPYLLDTIDKNEFDTIYHEHLSYLSVMPLKKLFAENNLQILDLIHNPIHGGSLCVYLGQKNSTHKPTNSINDFLKEEKMKKINTKKYYDDFTKRVFNIKKELVAFLKTQKKLGKKIVGYGASAKGNVLLNFCRLDAKTIDYVVDSIPYKQGRFTPGTHIPIYPESRLVDDQPDFALLFSWTFLEEILSKQEKYRSKGGRFIITIPSLRIE